MLARLLTDLFGRSAHAAGREIAASPAGGGPAEGGPGGSPRIHLAVASLIAIGGVLRLIQYMARRSLWLDEAMVAVNVGSRSFADLVRPLDYEQMAPPFFLWAERAVLLAGGASEWTLRAIPVLAGILLPVVTWKVARRALPPNWALLAVGLVAFSPILIRFSNEVKPYAVAAIVGAVLIVLALELLQVPDNKAAWWKLGIAGTLAIGVSTGAIFVLAALLLAIAVAEPVRKDPVLLKRLGLAGAVWSSTFALIYVAIYRHSSTSPYMAAFWETGFVRPFEREFPERLWGAMDGVLSSLLVGTLSPARWGAPVAHATTAQMLLAAALIAIGFVLTARRRNLAEALVLGGPMGVAFAASMAEYIRSIFAWYSSLSRVWPCSSPQGCGGLRPSFR